MLLEKPIANEPHEARRIHELAQAASPPVLLGHLLRFDPRYAAIHDELDAGALGEIIAMSARRAIPMAWSERMAGRVHPVKQISTHDVDLLCWYAGAEVEEVYSIETSSRLTKYGVPDVVHTVIQFQSGPIATVETHGVWPETFPEEIAARLEVTGTKGGARARAPDGGLHLAADKATMPDSGHWPMVRGEVTGSLRRQFDHFLDCINGAQPLVSTADALRAFSVTDAIVTSLETGEPIKPTSLV